LVSLDAAGCAIDRYEDATSNKRRRRSLNASVKFPTTVEASSGDANARLTQVQGADNGLPEEQGMFVVSRAGAYIGHARERDLHMKENVGTHRHDERHTGVSFHGCSSAQWLQLTSPGKSSEIGTKGVLGVSQLEEST